MPALIALFGAQVVVTYNLADFPKSVLTPLGIEAQHPDLFVRQLLDRDPTTVCAAIRQHRNTLKNPAKSVDEFLERLEQQQLRQTVQRLAGFHAVL